MVTLNPYRQPCPYDIGDTLITENATDPAKRWPGTAWRKEEGVFLLGASSTYPVGSTGGAKNVTLINENIPMSYNNTAVSNGGNVASLAAVQIRWDWDGTSYINTGITEYGDKNGNATPHENMPPYKAKYIWRAPPEPAKGVAA